MEEQALLFASFFRYFTCPSSVGSGPKKTGPGQAKALNVGLGLGPGLSPSLKPGPRAGRAYQAQHLTN